jgi:hypothetical protein
VSRLSAASPQREQTGRAAQGQDRSGREQHHYGGVRSAAFGELGGDGTRTGGFDDIGARDDGGDALAFLGLGVQR